MFGFYVDVNILGVQEFIQLLGTLNHIKRLIEANTFLFVVK